jgi:hypothetical protein
MKKILLGVAAMCAEMFRREVAQFFRGHATTAPREIFFEKDALNPDVDWERAQAFVGEKHDTVGHFASDPRKRAKLVSQFFIGQASERFEVHFSAGD